MRGGRRGRRLRERPPRPLAPRAPWRAFPLGAGERGGPLLFAAGCPLPPRLASPRRGASAAGQGARPRRLPAAGQALPRGSLSVTPPPPSPLCRGRPGPGAVWSSPGGSPARPAPGARGPRPPTASARLVRAPSGAGGLGGDLRGWEEREATGE